jgi:hypothetical protein
MRREWVAAGALVAAVGAWAQQAPDFLPGQMGKPTQADPADWKEADVPPPPALRTDGLIAIDTGATALRFGIDPASVGVGKDRVVRYVIVAKSASGALNAMYEGLHCERDEYRIYARYVPGEGWRTADGDWKPLDGIEANHVRAVARSGACLGHAPSGTADQIVRNLRSPQDTRFGGSRY